VKEFQFGKGTCSETVHQSPSEDTLMQFMMGRASNESNQGPVESRFFGFWSSGAKFERVIKAADFLKPYGIAIILSASSDSYPGGIPLISLREFFLNSSR
jgi:hypothetical protein